MPPQEQTQTPIALSESDQQQVLELYQKIQRSRAKLVGPDGKTQSLPVSLYEFLVTLIADLCEGQSVAIVQNDAQLTTVEAARMLGVSRQFLIGQLEKGEIPFHMVGTHRRLYVRDVLAYKLQRDGKRRRGRGTRRFRRVHMDLRVVVALGIYRSAIDSGRTGDLEPLLRDMAKQRVLAGIVEVTAFSAHSLAASVISDIHSEAKKLYPQAKRIIINERHDPDLIGGVRLEFPDYQLDLSIRSQLNRFRTLTTAERTV